MIYALGIILFILFTGIIFALIYNLGPNTKSVIGVSIAAVIAIIISFPVTRTIVTFADNKFNPVPVIHLGTSQIKLTGKETTGTLYGEALPYSTVKLIKSDKVIFTVETDIEGQFNIKKLHDSSKYQIVSSKNGKNSKKYDITVGKIPNTAVTDLNFSNNDSSYKTKSDKNNRATISGKTNPKALIKVKDKSGKVLDKITADKKGKWSVEVDGPGINQNSPEKIKYEFVSKLGQLKENSGNYLTVIKFKTDTPKKESEKESEKPVEQPKVKTPPAPVAPTTPAIPGEYLAALNNARDYLSFSNMSKRGLYDQLTSEYGEKFPADAAQYAVDNLQADWNLEALNCAKDYRKDQNMSTSEIYDQLISDYGEQFAPSEANYAIQHLYD
ncbi:Ltp family lipoprotein [Companilactobacillus keshanensis]|uniref:Ltp family lipoprotein n=1 Tax=Companilactobacillus keshanensis TaxID=2486003 RepID=A0ABW4BXE5_9LACO|nr:Ltp family lipoprotein [Companilactobacillus keshanensis]